MDNAAQVVAEPIPAKKECFVLMPISDPDGYPKGHFKHVYDDIVAPACKQAGFEAIRADQVKQSNLIHLDILQRLLDTPMAVCDLSARNPNVFFELALRQAFDKPVALIQEVGTPAVFDISPIRTTEYRKELTYHEVLEDQKAIAAAVTATFDAHTDGKGVNSIVKLLALSKPASLPEINPPEASADMQQLILAEVSRLRDEVRGSRRHVVGARRLVRECDDSECGLLLHTLEQAESLLAHCSEPEDLDNVKTLISHSRHRWVRLMENRQALADTDRNRLFQCDQWLDRLEHDLHRACERYEARREH